MPGAARVTVDVAGGTITGNLAPTVFVNGVPIAVRGASVAGHGNGPHGGPSMAQGESTVLANNIPVCRAGHTATCGHATSGSSNVFVG